MMFHAGEPLIFFDRLVDISSFGKSMGLQVTVTTNGLRPLSDDDVRRLADSCTHVAISIDSRFKEHHDKVRGFEGSFDKAMTLMKRIKSIAMRHPPRLVATSVLTNKNLPDFAAYVRFMLSQGFDEVGFSLLEPTIGLGPFKFDQYYDDNKITSIDDFQAYMSAASIEGLSVSRQNWETLTEVIRTDSGYAGLCNSSSRNIIVGRDMSIKLCYVKESIETWNSAGDLMSIWNSNSAWKRRKEDASCTRVCGSSYCHRKLKS
jgi:MoaA/NifB/PqqE/SkfB family radical SAM enzyme